MAMISLLVCSRVSGNKNFGLQNLLDSLKQFTTNYENIEVLVKFDSDDNKVPKILPKLGSYPFKIKYIVEPRGRGYLDINVFYNRLFTIVDEKSLVLVAIGDDFKIIQRGWDEIILSRVKLYPDQIFIIHGRPHPPTDRKNYQEQKFYLTFDINALEDLYIIDEAPLWSRKLIDICGGFGSTSTTDCWTLTLEYFLFHRCGINRTIFLEELFVYRTTKDEVDQPVAMRWWTDRPKIFAFLRSPFYKALVEQQALNIYNYIKMSEIEAVPKPFIPPKSDFRPATITQEEIRRIRRQALAAKLVRKEQVFTAKLAVKAQKVLPHPLYNGLAKVYRTVRPLLPNAGNTSRGGKDEA